MAKTCVDGSDESVLPADARQYFAGRWTSCSRTRRSESGSAPLQPLQSAAVTMVGAVITGELKSRIDGVWNAFWSGGISNPLEVIEQITYLLFLRRLDDLQTLAEGKARVAGTGVIENPVFLPGQEPLRWSRFKNTAPEVMYATVAGPVFDYLKALGTQLGGDDR